MALPLFPFFPSLRECYIRHSIVFFSPTRPTHSTRNSRRRYRSDCSSAFFFFSFGLTHRLVHEIPSPSFCTSGRSDPRDAGRTHRPDRLFSFFLSFLSRRVKESQFLSVRMVDEWKLGIRVSIMDCFSFFFFFSSFLHSQAEAPRKTFPQPVAGPRAG